MPALLLPNEIRSMSAQSVRRLVETGDGDCALLYLALLDCGDPGRAGAMLHWSPTRVEGAWGRLAGLELVSGERAPAPTRQEPPAEPVRYSREDLMAAMGQEGEFSCLYREVERLLCRNLSEADLTSLYRIYDDLSLPSEVILLLVGYTIRTTRHQKQSEGALPRMPQIQREAYRWKRLGLDTAETAEEYLRRQQQVDGREWEILSLVGVAQRRPAVEKEREFIAAWVELGLSDELISMAYQRTVYQKGQMNWPYMNKILLSWHQAGYRTPEQVKAGDKPAPRAPARGKQAAENYQPSAERIRKNGDWLDEFLKEQEKGR